MNTASLELSKELYELSGWGYATTYYHPKNVLIDNREKDMSICPAYDLGYLLRRLPGAILNNGLIFLKGGSENSFDYKIGYGNASAVDDLIHWSKFRYEIDEPETPEDAACKLLIELFKQGVLVKSND